MEPCCRPLRWGSPTGVFHPAVTPQPIAFERSHRSNFKNGGDNIHCILFVTGRYFEFFIDSRSVFLETPQSRLSISSFDDLSYFMSRF